MERKWKLIWIWQIVRRMLPLWKIRPLGRELLVEFRIRCSRGLGSGRSIIMAGRIMAVGSATATAGGITTAATSEASSGQLCTERNTIIACQASIGSSMDRFNLGIARTHRPFWRQSGLTVHHGDQGGDDQCHMEAEVRSQDHVRHGCSDSCVPTMVWIRISDVSRTTDEPSECEWNENQSTWIQNDLLQDE